MNHTESGQVGFQKAYVSVMYIVHVNIHLCIMRYNVKYKVKAKKSRSYCSISLSFKTSNIKYAMNNL